MEATQDETSAPYERGQKCAKMKTDVKFENTINSYVKFRPEIEKNDKTILEATEDEVSAPQKGSKMCQNEN